MMEEEYRFDTSTGIDWTTISNTTQTTSTGPVRSEVWVDTDGQVRAAPQDDGMRDDLQTSSIIDSLGGMFRRYGSGNAIYYKGFLNHDYKEHLDSAREAALRSGLVNNSNNNRKKHMVLS